MKTVTDIFIARAGNCFGSSLIDDKDKMIDKNLLFSDILKGTILFIERYCINYEGKKSSKSYMYIFHSCDSEGNRAVDGSFV